MQIIFTSYRYMLAALFGVSLMLASTTASVAAGYDNVQSLPVNFKSKQLSHDDAKQTVTAVGDVELIQGNRILRADKMVYNLETDTVSAMGNVSLLDEDGSVHFAEYVELTQNMKQGFIHSLLSMLGDGSRFTAVEAQRQNGVKTTMVDASYTPCKVCETNPKPLWQIKADKVVHDEVEKTIKYKNARFEFAGVPFAYTPLFSHSDPSVKRKSGFLRPNYGWGSDTGTYVEGGYYFGDIAPNIDMTLRVRPSTLSGTLLNGEWRQRFERGRLQINASGVESDREEEDGRIEENRKRGYIEATGLYDVDNKWRTGFNLERVSDKEYLRLYDVASANVLRSEAYAERFSGRDYTRINALNFQDVRLGLRPDQPDVIPQLNHQMVGRANGLLGGRWDAGVSSLILRRDSDGQDVERASTNIGWERQKIFNNGISAKLHTGARGDFYSLQNRDAAVLNPALDSNSRAFRGMAVADVTASYPMVKRVNSAQWIIEPIVGGSVSPQVRENDVDIPNEDSLDVQFDVNNLFDDNRFPGIDKQEDGARVNYGMKSGVYADDGRFGKVYIGQSYRFDDDAIFPNGSGLEDNSSDVVGQISAGFAPSFTADYRFQLDNKNMSIRRHEVRATGGTDKYTLATKYMYAGAVEGTGIDEAREQVSLTALYRIDENWSANTGSLVDLGEEPGLRKASLGLGYADECFSFLVEGTRNLIDDAIGESETVLMMRIGFKNIGEFSAPGISLAKQVEKPQ